MKFNRKLNFFFLGEILQKHHVAYCRAEEMNLSVFLLALHCIGCRFDRLLLQNIDMTCVDICV